MTFELRTARLRLRTLDKSHAEQVRDYFARNRDFLEPWEARRSEEYYTVKTHKKLLAADRESEELGQMFKVWIFKSEEPQRVIGSISLSNIVRGAFLSCHLGYRLDHEEVNKGYMTEALREVIRYAFEGLKLHRIEANIMPRNAASLAVVEKLGFYQEGLARKYLYINGAWEDHIHMVLRNEAMEG
ncbi:GNAT family N-acetyltransferase [Cohnella thailandensis]|uniref:GNAT family N-acetyltransferase n=1 Tax=Cohnella thailandensis TaxID=557557 RepID=A0A841SRE9_9BACL|nr:GNAT family N-acetyltransferase [Cohnella thailandensis]MBB6634973.1 GNAT family N-acetyltransferase [Cohnella thailandensis]MBP1975804.1 ribosomal-protein-alanine N-acetyltransferase [Cohnella thailandensis]